MIRTVRMKRRKNILCLMLAVALALLVASVPQATTRAQEPSRVALLVDFGNGTVATRCIEFSEPEISGHEVLRRSGLSVVAHAVSGMGVIICDIGGVSGCPASDCFCQCQGMSCMYWKYYHQEGGSWQYSALGASTHTVRHGDVEAWAWGPGNSSRGTEPPDLSFDEICAAGDAPASAETPGSPPDSLQLPSPTPSAQTTATQTPSPTPSPTEQPTATPSPSPTPSRATEPSPAPTVTESAQPETLDESPEDGEELASSYRPASYAVFALIVGGLLGWLIFLTKVRK